MEKKIIKTLKRAVLTLGILMFGLHLSAQQGTITGTVTDGMENTPLIGATVKVKGTTRGTVTDIDGNYTINAAPGDVLVYSFVGMLTEEIVLGTQSSVDITLYPDLAELDEVVVIGYGTQKKSDLTGAVAVVDAEELNRTDLESFDKALQGRAPGVLVTRQSGAPGSGVKIKVRGIGSINSDTEPLYVIDGVPVGDGAINSINPQDIESLQILKDASATAIYGARGANGVVIVTTKRGSESNKLNVNFAATGKYSEIRRRLDLMNATEYLQFLEKAANNTTDPNYALPMPANDSIRQAWGISDEGTDWQDAIVRPAWGQNYNLGISGGNQYSNFYVSGNYYQEDGILVNSAYERYNLRINSDFKLFNNRVRVGESVLIVRANQDGSQNGDFSLVQATYSSPLMSLYDPTDPHGFAGPVDSITGANEQTNAVAERILRDEDKLNTRILGNIYTEIDIIKNLTYKFAFGTEITNGLEEQFTPEYTLGNIGFRASPFPILQEKANRFNSTLFTNTLSYNNSFGVHNISLLAGQEFETQIQNGTTVQVQEFKSNDNISIGNGIRTSNRESSASEYKILSYLSRVMYDYSGKYYFTASVRWDGSSRFGVAADRIGFFPSFSVGWKLNEDLLQAVEEINMLKLRFGWGITGNDNIGNYRYQTYLDPVDEARYPFNNTASALGVSAFRSTGNPAIKWEEAKMTNIGVDLTAFNNRIQFTGEYYIKNQDDMLVQIEIPMTYGKNVADDGAKPFVNLGRVQNRGLEMSLTHKNNLGLFEYGFSANLTTIKNEVLELPDDVPIFQDRTITAVGHTIGSFYGYVADGILQEDDFVMRDGKLVPKHAFQKDGTAPGDIKFVDLNNDGVITEADRTIIGKPVPDFVYGLNLEAGYRGIDFSVFLSGMHNLDVYNNHMTYIGLGTDRLAKDLNKLSDLNPWTPGSGINDQTRADTRDINDNARTSSFWIENASFLRLQSVQVGYSLPMEVLNRLKMSSARVYFNVNNLHVFTNYSGFDPEIGEGGNDVLEAGIDNGNYPIPRTYTFGIQFNL